MRYISIYMECSYNNHRGSILKWNIYICVCVNTATLTIEDVYWRNTSKKNYKHKCLWGCLIGENGYCRWKYLVLWSNRTMLKEERFFWPNVSEDSDKKVCAKHRWIAAKRGKLTTAVLTWFAVWKVHWEDFWKANYF